MWKDSRLQGENDAGIKVRESQENHAFRPDRRDITEILLKTTALNSNQLQQAKLKYQVNSYRSQMLKFNK